MHIKEKWCCYPIYERLWYPTLSHNTIEFSFQKKPIKNSQPWHPWLYQTHREGGSKLTFYIRARVEWETLTWLYQTILKTEMRIYTPGNRSNLQVWQGEKKCLTVSCLERAVSSSHPKEECRVLCLQHTNVDDPIPFFFQAPWSLQLFRSCLTLLGLLWTRSGLSAPFTVGDSRSRHGISELVALITLSISTQGFLG